MPPTPQGEALAHKQLDAAWRRYPALVSKLQILESRAEQHARVLFAATNRLYATAGTPIHVKVVLFVGQFDGNEFTVPAMNGQPPTVVMPVENPMLKVQLAHEMSHAVNIQLADEPGWFKRCTAKRVAVTKGILPYLTQSRATVATKFTFGLGTTGMDRELYCAGWYVVGSMLASGETFPQLARVPESRMVEKVAVAMQRQLALWSAPDVGTGVFHGW